MVTISSIIDTMELEFTALESEIYSLDGIFLESGADMNSTVDTIVAKIRGIIETAKKKITEIFEKAVVKKKLAETQKKIDENPSLKTQKVKVKDYSKLEKLDDDTLRAIASGKDVEATMVKYRKHRNVLLAAAATVTITLGTALVMVTRNKDKRINNLNAKLGKTEATLKKCINQNGRLKSSLKTTRERNKQLSDDLEVAKAKGLRKTSVKGKQIRRDVQDAAANASNSMNATKEIMSANVEIFKNAGTDTLNSVKEVLGVCMNPTSSPIKKAGAVVKGAAKIGNTVKEVSDGSAKKNVMDGRKSEFADKITHLRGEIDKAKEVFNSANASAEQKSKAGQYITRAESQIRSLKVKMKRL